MTLRYVLSKLIKNPTAVIGLVLLLAFVVLAVNSFIQARRSDGA